MEINNMEINMDCAIAAARNVAIFDGLTIQGNIKLDLTSEEDEKHAEEIAIRYKMHLWVYNGVTYMSKTKPQPSVCNCTPHAVNLVRKDGSVLSVPPSGFVARVEETTEGDLHFKGVPVTKVTYGAITGMPTDIMPGSIIIVSRVIAQAVQAQYPDLSVLFPNKLIRDKDGNVVGASELSHF